MSASGNVAASDGMAPAEPRVIIEANGINSFPHLGQRDGAATTNDRLPSSIFPSASDTGGMVAAEPSVMDVDSAKSSLGAEQENGVATTVNHTSETGCDGVDTSTPDGKRFETAVDATIGSIASAMDVDGAKSSLCPEQDNGTTITVNYTSAAGCDDVDTSARNSEHFETAVDATVGSIATTANHTLAPGRDDMVERAESSTIDSPVEVVIPAYMPILVAQYLHDVSADRRWQNVLNKFFEFEIACPPNGVSRFQVFV